LKHFGNELMPRTELVGGGAVSLLLIKAREDGHKDKQSVPLSVRPAFEPLARAGIEAERAGEEFLAGQFPRSLEADDEVVMVAHEGEGGDVEAVGVGVEFDEAQEFMADDGVAEGGYSPFLAATEA
jgi:hypothetical protein